METDKVSLEYSASFTQNVFRPSLLDTQAESDRHRRLHALSSILSSSFLLSLSLFCYYFSFNLQFTYFIFESAIFFIVARLFLLQTQCLFYRQQRRKRERERQIPMGMAMQRSTGKNTRGDRTANDGASFLFLFSRAAVAVVASLRSGS